MPDFLLEIGVEEIPDWMIDGALGDLRSRFEQVQKDSKLGGSVHCTQATPRRLVLHVKDLADRQADSDELISGPPKSAGTGAIQGFARKMGVSADALETTTTDKGEYLAFRKRTNGRTTNAVLAEALPSIITGIYFPKSMYWTGKAGVRFIRPIRWILALIGTDVVPFEVAGVQSGATTRGHRILGERGPLQVFIETYEDVLRRNGVIVRAVERQRIIESGLPANVATDPELLKTLVYLTEFPSLVRGSFDPAYLELPKEILSTVMRHHQRYFSALEPDGSLAPEFVAVANTDGDPDGLIRQGNERVLRARFNDARFFWKVDQTKPLSSRIDDLAKVTFQAKLGTYRNKTDRVVALAGRLATQIGADVATVERAALLAKCDLTTDMVKEFTELQGVVGGLYATAQGETEAVAAAIYDHYKPVSMEDEIPRTLEGQILSIADKMDTLIECFRVGLVPTGSKDPLALRRAAQGVIRILFEARLPLAVKWPELDAFFRERIEYYLRDVKGFAYDEVNAALGAPLSSLPDLADRVEALRAVRPTENFEPLAASFKRIKNILRQADYKGAGSVDSARLSEGPERALFEELANVRGRLQEDTSYRDKFAAIATLRPAVDLFFDKILVNDPDPALRQNRLALLASLLTEFSTIADFSEIVTQGSASVANRCDKI